MDKSRLQQFVEHLDSLSVEDKTDPNKTILSDFLDMKGW